MHALTRQHLDSLNDRAITQSNAELNKITSLTQQEASTALFGVANDTLIHGSAMSIPYFDINGVQIIGADGSPYARYRVFDTRDEKNLKKGEKLQRYLSRASTGSQVYVPAGFKALLAVSEFTVITEGELKALSATSIGIACVGIAGTSNWAATAGEGLTSKTVVNASLLAIARQSRAVIVLADSDAKTNAQVRTAMQALADALAEQAGVPTLFLTIPTPAKRKDASVEKRGLDDEIKAEGALKVEKWLTLEIRREIKRLDVVKNAVYSALGVNGTSMYVWSIPLSALVTLTPATVLHPGSLASLAGGMEWPMAAHGKRSQSGDATVNWQEMGCEVIKSAVAAGLYSPDSLRGGGVWADENNELIVNSATIFRPDGKEQLRYGSKNVYPSRIDLGVSSSTPQATVEDSKKILEAFESFKFARPTDALLAFAWSCAAYYAGALNWRTHLAVTGLPGSGKSTAQRLFMNLLGGAMVRGAGFGTAIGLSQKIKDNSIAVLVEEAEAGKNMTGILDLARVASEGAEAYKGSSDHTVVSFLSRFPMMMVGVNPPAYKQADEGRYVKLTLKVHDYEGEVVHELLKEEKSAKEIGKKLYSRMLHAWPRMKRTMTALRPHLGGGSRYAQSMCPVLSSAWVALFDEEMTDTDAIEFLAGLNLDEDKERMIARERDSDIFDFVLSKRVQVIQDGNHVQVTCAEAIARALEELRKKDTTGSCASAIRLYGMRVVFDDYGQNGALLIDPKNAQFRDFFKGTDWEFASIESQLMSVPGAEPKRMATSVRIGGAPMKPIVIALPYLETGM